MDLNRKRLILASQSPRRSELLKSMNLSFEILPSQVDEVFRQDRSPAENALSIAEEKARWIYERNKNNFVIGADTIVVLDNKIIGKPADENHARRILNDLSGKEHEVITGVALIDPEGNLYQEAAVSKVKFKTLSNETIDEYIKTGEPMDKAGAYAIQGQGSVLIDSHSGSWSNIVGLPTEVMNKLLSHSGYYGGNHI